MAPKTTNTALNETLAQLVRNCPAFYTGPKDVPIADMSVRTAFIALIGMFKKAEQDANLFVPDKNKIQNGYPIEKSLLALTLRQKQGEEISYALYNKLQSTARYNKPIDQNAIDLICSQLKKKGLGALLDPVAFTGNIKLIYDGETRIHTNTRPAAPTP